jgi:DNA-binding response OmpR family regulator
VESAKKILVISSRAALRHQLEDYLSEWNYQIFHTPVADDTLKLILDEMLPDLVVVDPEMSGLKGIEICLRIRQRSPIPILILSLASEMSHEVRMLDLTAENYFSEPFDIAIAANRINHILTLSPSR